MIYQQFELNFHTELGPGKSLSQSKFVFDAFIFPFKDFCISQDIYPLVFQSP